MEPGFNNGITPAGQPEPPVLEELVPMIPREQVETDYVVPTDVQYRQPVEKVPGVGGILGVQAEE